MPSKTKSKAKAKKAPKSPAKKSAAPKRAKPSKSKPAARAKAKSPAPAKVEAAPAAPAPTPGVPPGMRTVTPHLVCAGANEAIEFYKKAFNAVAQGVMPTPDGKVMHASIQIGDSVIFLVDEFPNWGSLGPKARGGASVTMHLYVSDVDSLTAQALAAGATVKMPVQDMFWGDRYGIVTDPYGHDWSIATHVRDVSPEEMAKAASQAPC